MAVVWMTKRAAQTPTCKSRVLAVVGEAKATALGRMGPGFFVGLRSNDKRTVLEHGFCFAVLPYTEQPRLIFGQAGLHKALGCGLPSATRGAYPFLFAVFAR